MADTLTPCDIVLLPAAGLAQQSIDTSRRLSRESNALFTLDEAVSVPHISLYMGQFGATGLEKLQALLGSIAASTPPFSLTVTSYMQADGYVDANYARSDALDHLQMAVVNGANPLRDGILTEDATRLETADGEGRGNLETYGYQFVGELFRPHLTLMRLNDNGTVDTNTLPEPDEFSGQFVHLGVFELGENGRCVRKIASFDLTGNGGY
jgi:2'-5' RNA ligase